MANCGFPATLQARCGQQAARNSFDLSQQLAFARARSAIHLGDVNRGADDVQAVRRGFAGDLLQLACPRQGRVGDGQFEVLGDLVLVDDPTHAQPDGIGAVQIARVHPFLHLARSTSVALKSSSRLCARSLGSASSRHANRRSPGWSEQVRCTRLR